MTLKLNRRSALRGLVGGSAVTVGLPFLDCFLNGNGNALASGTELPTRFGTWFWGLGMTKSIYQPKKLGADYDLPEEVESLAPVKQHLNFYSNFSIPLDGRPNVCHYTGWAAVRTGTAPRARGELNGSSLDVLVADQIGNASRFRSIQLSATGQPRDNYSFRNANAFNPPETSALEFYSRVFGPEFQDPNSDKFTPNPRLMVQKSVLSGVLDESKSLKNVVGAADRARLDQYFSSIRDMENRLAIQLEKPAPALACRVPSKSASEIPVGVDVEVVRDRHNLMTDILIAALACNQTRVFNMAYSNSGSALSRKGFERTHHVATHEDMNDPKLGYQVLPSWFVRRSMEAWSYFVASLASVKEGDSSLLDRSLVFAHSDQEWARTHSIDGMPYWSAGKAGGRIKTGLHIDGGKTPVSRINYTLLRAFGLQIPEYGTDSLRTSKEIGEILT